MNSILKKRKKKKPFDLEYSENFFASEDDFNINNSYYFSCHDYKKKESLYVRLAYRGTSVVETWVFFQKEDKSYYHDVLYYKTEDTPLFVKKIDTSVYEIKFKGQLKDEKGEYVSAELEFIFEPTREVVDFFYHAPTITMAKAIAFEKWSEQYFKQYQENDQVHYEQVGNVKGKILLGDESHLIDLPAVRDHSHGKRDWTYMNNHIWLMGVSKTKELNFSMVSYPTMTLLETGNYFSDKDCYYILKCDYDRNLFIKDVAPEYFEMKFKMTNKKTYIAKVKKINETPYLFQDGGYLLIEGICEIDIDGEKIRGILEVGFNKNKDRYFNGHKVKELKI